MAKKEKIEECKIIVSKNGPYLVSGNLPLDKAIIEVDDNDEPLKWKHEKKFPDKESYALCRCGHSKNKPFCDGSHNRVRILWAKPPHVSGVDECPQCA